MVFSKPRYPRYAIDLSHPAIRYAIAAAITVSGRYAATFPNNGPCLMNIIYTKIAILLIKYFNFSLTKMASKWQKWFRVLFGNR